LAAVEPSLTAVADCEEEDVDDSPPSMPVPLADVSSRNDDDDDDEYAPLRFVASVLGMSIPDEEENAPEERTRWVKSIHAAVMKWWFRNVAIFGGCFLVG
jgi:hypothetical protein